MRIWMPLLIGGSLALLGCGGNGSASPGAVVNGQGGASSGGGQAFFSGVPGNLTLGSLSNAQKQQLCQDTKAFYNALGATLKEVTCERVGIDAASGTMAVTDAAARSTCQKAYDACVAQPVGMSSLSCDDTPDSTCVATVAEYEACLQDSGTNLASQYDALPPCQSLTTVSLPSLGAGGAGPSPPSCTAFEQKCPQALTP